MTMMPSSSDEASTISSALAESSRAEKSLMVRCRLLQLSMLQPHTVYHKLSVVVVEWLAGRNGTPALQASFAQQCVHHAVGKPARTQTPINDVTISDTFNCAIITG